MSFNKVLIIAESLTGNTISFVDYVIEMFSGKYEFTVKKPREIGDDFDFSEYDKVMIGSYTWSDGKIPVKTKKTAIQHRDVLMEKDVLIFGTGWTMYPFFCGAVDGLYIILGEKFPTIKFELRFDPDVEEEAVESINKFLGDGI